MCEGGISSEQALCGRVRLGRRDTLDENLGLVIEVQASVLLENETDVREYLERNGELGLDVTVVCVFITAVCVFITAGPIIKLCAGDVCVYYCRTYYKAVRGGVRGYPQSRQGSRPGHGP